MNVKEANSLPVIPPIPDQVVTAGEEFTLTIEGEDTDIPEQKLVFSFKDSFESAMIDRTTGVFRWKPGLGQEGPHQFTALVTEIDENDEEIGVSELAFTITVQKAAPPTPAKLSVSYEDTLAQLTIQGDPGRTYTLQATTDFGASWGDLATVKINDSGQFTFSDPDSLKFPFRFYRIAG